MRDSPFVGTVADNLPPVELPYDTGVGHMLVGDEGAAVFVAFHERTEVPPHRHGAQWGVVIRGEMILDLDGEHIRVGPGEWYDIPAGVPHGAVVEAGTALIDVFADPDRFRAAKLDSQPRVI